jgi:hypothetical protein
MSNIQYLGCAKPKKSCSSASHPSCSSASSPSCPIQPPACPKWTDCPPVDINCGERCVIVPARTIHPKPVTKCLGKRTVCPKPFYIKVKVTPPPFDIDLGEVTMCSEAVHIPACKAKIPGQKIQLVPRHKEYPCDDVVLDDCRECKRY